MEQLTPAVIWSAVMAVCSAVVLLSNAVEKIVKAIKAAKAPNAHQDERLDALEAWRSIVDSKLNQDNERLGNIEDGNRVTQRALLALLAHGIDGNNIEQMQTAKEKLEKYLIEK